MDYQFTEDIVHDLAEVLSVNASKVFEVFKEDLQDLRSTAQKSLDGPEQRNCLFITPNI